MKFVASVLVSLILGTPAAATGLQHAVHASAVSHGLPPALAHGVVMVESRYRCDAVGGGAHGIMQVKPATARGVGVHGNLLHCATGLEAGMRYLRKAYQIAGGDWCSAASLFNRGLGAKVSCSPYGRKVLSHAR